MTLRSQIESALADAGAKNLVVAVSGGNDSVVLLHLLCSLREELSLKLTVAHFDHRLRAESEAESDFVRDLAEALECDVQVGVADKVPSANIEAWAREQRYRFLESVRDGTGADFICTAHHRDDQAETLLFRILSGRLSTRGYGIASADPVRHLLRPLLGASRDQLEEYAGEHALRFCTDSSNFDRTRTRNRIRAELIPRLEQDFNPGLKATLGELSHRLADDENLLWKEAEELVRTLYQTGWSHERFCAAPPALRWRSLGVLAKRTGLTGSRDAGYGKLKLLEERILRAGGERFELDLGGAVRAQYSTRNGVNFKSIQQIAPLDVESPAADQPSMIVGSIDTRESELRYSSGKSLIPKSLLP